MRFIDHDLKHQRAGSIVRVRLQGNSANVMLLDSSNFEHYRRGEPFNCLGGHFNRSPAVLRVPSRGYWHVVVDLGGALGQVRSSAEVVPA